MATHLELRPPVPAALIEGCYPASMARRVGRKGIVLGALIVGGALLFAGSRARGALELREIEQLVGQDVASLEIVLLRETGPESPARGGRGRLLVTETSDIEAYLAGLRAGVGLGTRRKAARRFRVEILCADGRSFRQGVNVKAGDQNAYVEGPWHGYSRRSAGLYRWLIEHGLVRE